jgi:hypothetical protein
MAVFLRVLEYYSGILFLTTNRVGALDEAFKSRIHLPLYYPPLDRVSTLKIWAMHLDRTFGPGSKVRGDKKKIMKFAEAHFDHNETGRWNGRQIRNAFQTAIALAEYEAQERKPPDDTTDATPSVLTSDTFKLKVQHFETVEAASMVFEDYINDVAGTTAADRTYSKGNRNDKFDGTHADDHTPKKKGVPKYASFYHEESDSEGQSDQGSTATTLYEVQSDRSGTSKVSRRRSKQTQDDPDNAKSRRHSHRLSINKNDDTKNDEKGRISRENITTAHNKGFDEYIEAQVSIPTKNQKRHTKALVRHASSEDSSD